MDVLKLIQTHLELECITVDLHRLLFSIPCANPEDLPRFYVAQHHTGYVQYFHQKLSPVIREELATIPIQEVLFDQEAVKRILEQDAPGHDTHAGKSYVFPEDISAAMYPDVIRLQNPNKLPRFMIQIDGEIVSACESSRENNFAGEAWVYTEPAFQCRGYAKQVTAAWAHNLQLQGKLAFYSHKHENLASFAVARSLEAISKMSADAKMEA